MRCLYLGIGLLLTLAGCGYTTGSMLPSHYRTIDVEPFKNKIAFLDVNVQALYVPRLESDVRTAIIDKFLSDGNLRIADAHNADLVMEGELLGLREDTVRVDVNQNVQQYRVHVIVSVRLIDRETGKVLWAEPSFAGETMYTPANVTQSQIQNLSQTQALTSALTDLASRLVARTVESW